MTMKLSRDAYQDLIDGNLDWLAAQPMSLERTHIEMILRASPKHEYDDQDRIATLERALRDLLPIAKKGAASHPSPDWATYDRVKALVER
jgi:hypothetical protein